MNITPPRLASTDEVHQVLKALRARSYKFREEGFRYVRFRLGFKPLGIVQELIDYLEAGKKLYLLPSDTNKLQGVLRLEAHLLVHFKIDPKRQNEPWFLWLNFHDHNTGFPPLPE